MRRPACTARVSILIRSSVDALLWNRMTKPACWVVILSALALPMRAAEPIRVMILDGQSGGPYHAWRQVSTVLRKELAEAGIFQVDIVTAPESGGDFSQFHPD